MSGKLNSKPYVVLDVTDSTTTETSEETIVYLRDNLSYDIEWSNGSGSPAGEFFVDARNMNEWEPLDFGSGVQILLTGNSGKHLINVNQTPFFEHRVRYVPSSGEIDLRIAVNSKKLGG